MANGKHNNFKEIEILRGIAILAVIILHVCGRSENMNHEDLTRIIFRTIFALSQFAVPLFIFLSGFTLTARYENNFSIKKFYRDRFKNIIPPYIIFSLIYMSFAINPDQITSQVLYSSVIKLFTATAFIHLWYIGLISQIYLFYPAIRMTIEKHKDHIFYLLLISVALQVFWIFGRSLIYFLGKDWRSYSFTRNVAWYFFVEYSIFLNVAYFVLGIYFQKKYSKIMEALDKRKIYLLILFILFVFSIILSYIQINNMYWKYLPLVLNLALFFNISVILLLFKLSSMINNLKNNIGKTLNIFGRYSFGIYLIHLLLFLYIERILNSVKISYYDWYYYIICIVLTAVFSLAATLIISFIPHHELIIGKIRYREKKT